MRRRRRQRGHGVEDTAGTQTSPPLPSTGRVEDEEATDDRFSSNPRRHGENPGRPLPGSPAASSRSGSSSGSDVRFALSVSPSSSRETQWTRNLPPKSETPHRVLEPWLPPSSPSSESQDSGSTSRSRSRSLPASPSRSSVGSDVESEAWDSQPSSSGSSDSCWFESSSSYSDSWNMSGSVRTPSSWGACLVSGSFPDVASSNQLEEGELTLPTSPPSPPCLCGSADGDASPWGAPGAGGDSSRSRSLDSSPRPPPRPAEPTLVYLKSITLQMEILAPRPCYPTILTFPRSLTRRRAAVGPAQEIVLRCEYCGQRMRSVPKFGQHRAMDMSFRFCCSKYQEFARAVSEIVEALEAEVERGKSPPVRRQVAPFPSKMLRMTSSVDSWAKEEAEEKCSVSSSRARLKKVRLVAAAEPQEIPDKASPRISDQDQKDQGSWKFKTSVKKVLSKARFLSVESMDILPEESYQEQMINPDVIKNVAEVMAKEIVQRGKAERKYIRRWQSLQEKSIDLEKLDTSEEVARKTIREGQEPPPAPAPSPAMASEQKECCSPSDSDDAETEEFEPLCYLSAKQMARIVARKSLPPEEKTQARTRRATAPFPQPKLGKRLDNALAKAVSKDLWKKLDIGLVIQLAGEIMHQAPKQLKEREKWKKQPPAEETVLPPDTSHAGMPPSAKTGELPADEVFSAAAKTKTVLPPDSSHAGMPPFAKTGELPADEVFSAAAKTKTVLPPDSSHARMPPFAKTGELPADEVFRAAAKTETVLSPDTSHAGMPPSAKTGELSADEVFRAAAKTETVLSPDTSHAGMPPSAKTGELSADEVFRAAAKTETVLSPDTSHAGMPPFAKTGELSADEVFRAAAKTETVLSPDTSHAGMPPSVKTGELSADEVFSAAAKTETVLSPDTSHAGMLPFANTGELSADEVFRAAAKTETVLSPDSSHAGMLPFAKTGALSADEVFKAAAETVALLTLQGIGRLRQSSSTSITPKEGQSQTSAGEGGEGAEEAAVEPREVTSAAEVFGANEIIKHVCGDCSVGMLTHNVAMEIKPTKTSEFKSVWCDLCHKKISKERSLWVVRQKITRGQAFGMGKMCTTTDSQTIISFRILSQKEPTSDIESDEPTPVPSPRRRSTKASEQTYLPPLIKHLPPLRKHLPPLRKHLPPLRKHLPGVRLIPEDMPYEGGRQKRRPTLAYSYKEGGYRWITDRREKKRNLIKLNKKRTFRGQAKGVDKETQSKVPQSNRKPGPTGRKSEMPVKSRYMEDTKKLQVNGGDVNKSLPVVQEEVKNKPKRRETTYSTKEIPLRKYSQVKNPPSPEDQLIRIRLGEMGLSVSARSSTTSFKEGLLKRFTRWRSLGTRSGKTSDFSLREFCHGCRVHIMGEMTPFPSETDVVEPRDCSLCQLRKTLVRAKVLLRKVTRVTLTRPHWIRIAPDSYSPHKAQRIKLPKIPLSKPIVENVVREREENRTRTLKASAEATADTAFTIQYRFSAPKFLKMGWTKRLPPIEMNDDLLHPPLNSEVDLLNLHRGLIVHKFYDSGKKFVTFLPDKSGQVYYPSGNLAIAISTTSKGRTTFVVREDEKTSPRILACFCEGGRGTWDFPSGDVRVSYNRLGGLQLDQGSCKRQQWRWWKPAADPPVSPFDPIFSRLNAFLAVHAITQDHVTLHFRYKKHCCKFEVGCRVKRSAPIHEDLLEAAKVEGPDRYMRSLKRRRSRAWSLLHALTTLTTKPMSPRLRKTLPPIRQPRVRIIREA